MHGDPRRRYSYPVPVNPFRSRPIRTVILTLSGMLLAWVLALLFAPAWPEFCDDAIAGAPCEQVAVQTMTGYLTIGLGVLTVIFGPIAAAFLDVVINGAEWETPRGTESIVTNMPLAIGAFYLVAGVAIAATA